MKPCREILALVLVMAMYSPSFSQADKKLDSLNNRADNYFKEKKYDSALLYYSEAITLIKENATNENLAIFASPVSLYIGKCLKELKDFQKAHKYFTYALQLGRANKFAPDITAAFVELNSLHKYITEQNIPFIYPAVEATEERNMLFPVAKAERLSGDSIRLRISGGRYDGITDSVFKGGLISRYVYKENRPHLLVNCYVRELHDNYLVAHAVYDTSLIVKAGDLVELKTRVPVSWRKLDAGISLLRGISFADNYRQPIFHSRYLYYYADSLTNKEMVTVTKSQIDDIVATLAEDTAKGEYVNVKGERGIFAGEHVMRALSNSDERHIRLFLEFANEFSRTYAGTLNKFSEAYATWIINNTPLAPSSVMPWLLNIRDQESRQRMAANLRKDILENELLDKWFNQGMVMANIDNTDSAFHLAGLISDVALSLQDRQREGWAGYLKGYTEKKLGNLKNADTSFRNALKKFKAAGNTEGEMWVMNALANLKSSRDVMVTLQTGHIFLYLMAPSPNSRYLATAGSYDKMIRVWDMIQGRTIASFSAHDDGINSIRYSPDGRYIVTASDDKTIKVWNAYDFSLIKTIRRPGAELCVIFTPDSKQLVAGGRDSLVKFIDPGTGTVVRTFSKHKGSVRSLCFLPTDPNYLFSGGSDSMVYKWNLEENDWKHWYSAKGRIMHVDISNNGKYMSLTCTDTLIRVWKLETNRFYFSIKPNYSPGENTDIAYPAFSPDGNYMALAHKNDTLDIVELSTLKEKVYGFKTERNQGMYDMVFSPDGSYLAVRMNLGGPLRVFNFAGWDFQNNSTVSVKEIKQYANIPLAVQFSPDDKSLAVVHESISRIDLRNGSTSHLYYGSFVLNNNYILMNDEKTGLYSNLLNTELVFYDFINKKEVQKLSFPDNTRNESIKRIELTGNNRLVFLGGERNTVTGYAMPEAKRIFSRQYETEENPGIHFLRYDSIRQRLFIIQNNDRIIVADPVSGNIITSLTADKPQTIEVSPAFLYITCDKSLVYKFDAKTYKLVKKIRVHHSGIDCYGSVMSSDYKYLVVQVADRFVTMDTKTDKVLYEKYDHDYANGAMSVSHNNKWLATGGFDSRIHLYHLASGKKISTIYTPREKDFMLVDDEGNYLAPKNTLEAVNFSFNNNSYGFEQFDSRFNRPHIVLGKIGAADSSLINTYKAAWKKRLRKLNIAEKELTADIHLPVTRLKDKFAIKPSTTSREYEISVECFDARYPLQSVHILVNNNPLFGSAGKKTGPNNGNMTMSFKVPLSNGPNKIKVFCSNTRGASSLAEYIEINGIYKEEKKPKTYFIGIAVSNYKDTSMNLRFAAKDVRDLAASFNKMFKNYEADTLIDAMATKENILALRNKLMKTTVNDKVIISVNGHGLLSDSLDFYYATYDNDFSKPAARGLKYEDLEALLDGIPARKKLLLIDACHSGALDKEELLAQQKKQSPGTNEATGPPDTIKGFASRGTITRNKKSKVDANSSYEVMQNLFADLSSGNGAVIISAAGGMEYAFESDDWNNGVFTYCIRKGIEEELADKDGGNLDRLTDVDELKNYVSRKVSELTKGKQRPVSRRENIDYIWVIW